MRSVLNYRGLKLIGLGGAISQTITHSDSTPEAETPSLIKQADDAVEASKAKIKTPLQFEQIKQNLSQTSVNGFDGFRCVVQKQINLNSIASHFFWLGSQAIGQSIYQYRFILHEDDKMLNVASDLDMNVEGEIKYPLFPSLSMKSVFTLADQAKNGTLEFEYSGNSFCNNFQINRNGAATSCGVSYVQSITPFFAVGGSGKYQIEKGLFKGAYSGIFDNGENLVVAMYDSALQVLFVKRVNRNRVHLGSLLVVDAQGSSQATASAEFILKQSKLNLSVDTDLLIKSAIETSVGPGMTMQFSAELSHPKEQYRFGYGIMIGGG